MKEIFFILGCCAASFSLQAQDKITVDSSEGWKKSGTFVLNVNQGSLQNWAAGGEQNTLGINSIVNYNIRFRREKNTWDNFFNLAFGFQNATSFKKFRKTDDKIDITSKYGHQLSKNWYAAVLANFNTQVLKGFSYTDTSIAKISNFLTPAKILLSLGFDYRPNTHFSLFISPASSRWILKLDEDFYNIDAFGVPAFKKTYNEIGAYLTGKYDKELNKWATYAGRLDLFSNYKRKPQNIDVLLTNLLTMKFNKWLGSTISVDLIYDDDVIKRTQLKETLGIGLVAKLK